MSEQDNNNINLNSDTAPSNTENTWQTVEQQSVQAQPEQVSVPVNADPPPVSAPVTATVTPINQTYTPYVSRYPSQPQPQFNPQATPFVSQPIPQPSGIGKERVKKHSGGNAATMVVSIVCVVLCAALLLANLMLSPSKNVVSGNGTGSTVTINQQAAPTVGSSSQGGGEMTSEEVVQKLLPSVVQVNITMQGGSGGGSGVIMSEDGYVITNAHVVENAQTISVITNDGTEHTAKLVAYDSQTDVGVVKMDGTFTPATFGDSSTVEAGEEVIAIGTPYSSALFQTVTKGIVSANRNGLSFESLGLTLDVIQHDAAINSGNSGGPLVNMYGQVIGINSVKMSGIYENLSFALQINKVVSVASELISKGAIERPMIGISGRTDSSIGGVYVAELTEGGAAVEAGLTVGDVITKLNDTRVKTIEELKSAIANFQIGDQVTVTLIRDGEVMTFTMALRSNV